MWYMFLLAHSAVSRRLTSPGPRMLIDKSSQIVCGISNSNLGEERQNVVVSMSGVTFAPEDSACDLVKQTEP